MLSDADSVILSTLKVIYQKLLLKKAKDVMKNILIGKVANGYGLEEKLLREIKEFAKIVN